MGTIARSGVGLRGATVALWLAGVAGIAIVRAADPGSVSVSELACSPAALVAGKVWTLVTSAFIIAGPPVPQLLMTGLVALAVVRLAGSRLWWMSAIGGHFGATFAAYAGIAIVHQADLAAAQGVIHAPDYGISAIWAATTGTLLVVLHRVGAHPRVTAACTVGLLGAFVALVGVDGELADVEHLLAVVIGLGAASVRSPSGEMATVSA
jgi:hypothetical protein